MATQTNNYGMIKPELTDTPDITQISNNFDIIDTKLYEQQIKIQSSVDTLASLKAIDTSLMPDKTIILCEGLGLFRYDSSSTATGDDIYIVTPTAGSGRWILIAETALGYSADTGSANTFVLTLPGITAYYIGLMVWFKVVNANTGACTINVNSLGAKSLVRPASTALVSGDLPAGAMACAVYDGTYFQLVSILGTNLVHLTATQTLTNKTLTSPVLTTPKFASAGYIADANGNELIKFTSTVASAVNEVTVSNSATGNAPSVSASGSDTNVGLDIKSKGTGIIRHYINGVISAVFDAVASAVNYLTIKSNITGSAPTINATGSDTNIDIDLIPKGTGRVKQNGTNLVLAGEDYRPNLLINGDFQVWQRGTDFNGITSTNGGYTADRWRAIAEGTGTISVNKNDDGLKFTVENTGHTSNIGYLFEINDFKKLVGKTITLTMQIYHEYLSSFDIAWFYTTVTKLSETKSTYNQPAGWNTFSVTYRVDSYDGQYYPFLQIFRCNVNNSSFGYHIIKYVKLEVNDHATPFIPLNYTEELTMCRRYYETFATTIDVGSAISSNNIHYCTGIPFTPKRVTPTATYTSANVVNVKISDITDIYTNAAELSADGELQPLLDLQDTAYSAGMIVTIAGSLDAEI